MTQPDKRTEVKKPPATPSGYRRILVGIDFTKASMDALRRARELALVDRSELIVMHVVEPAPFISGMEDVAIARSCKDVAEEARERLERLMYKTVNREIKTQVIVRIGKPEHELTKAAREMGADLIVTGKVEQNALQRWWFGNPAARLARHSSCDVLQVGRSGQQQMLTASRTDASAASANSRTRQ